MALKGTIKRDTRPKQASLFGHQGKRAIHVGHPTGSSASSDDRMRYSGRSHWGHARQVDNAGKVFNVNIKATISYMEDLL